MENQRLSQADSLRELPVGSRSSREELERRRNTARDGYERAKHELEKVENLLRDAESRERWGEPVWFG